MGRLFGVDILLNVWFLALLGVWALFGGIHALGLIVTVFLCVLLHEFGHVFMGRRFGIRCDTILLTPFGGLALMDFNENANNYSSWREFCVAIAGPLVNVALALLAIAMGWKTLLVINASLFIFNMIPAYPMDGGRIFKSILANFLTYRKTCKVAGAVGMAMGALIGMVCLYNLAFMGVLVGYMVVGWAYDEYKRN